jgi:flagellin
VGTAAGTVVSYEIAQSTSAAAAAFKAQDLVDAINAEGIDGLTASTNTSGQVVLTNTEGKNITINSETVTSGSTGGGSVAANSTSGLAVNGSSSTADVFRGQVTIEALEDITIGGNTPGNAGFLSGEKIIASGNLESVNVKTVIGANDAIKRVDSALTTINGIRSELGAIQNRFESTISNLSATSENLSAANSRIRDADFAAETAELARTQVLQQAGLSVLSQANARPQQVLQLLQG